MRSSPPIRTRWSKVKAKPTLIGWFVGQAMKASGGKANPQALNEILKRKLGLEEERPMGQGTPMAIARTLTAFAALAPLLAGCASPEVAGPSTTTATIRCNGPDLNAVKANGRPQLDEEAVTANYEQQLRATGVKAQAIQC